jgi:hypothetical protein
MILKISGFILLALLLSCWLFYIGIESRFATNILKYPAQICINLALINFAGYNGAFERKFQKQKKMFMNRFMFVLAVIDILTFSWYWNRWLFFFFSSVPWTFLDIAILGTLEKALSKSEMFSNKTKKYAKCAITFLFVSAIMNMFVVMFFVAIPVGVMGKPTL